LLSVRGNGINDQWAKRLNYKLSQPIKVKKIDLSENQLGDIAAKEIQIYFMDNPTIESLNLGNNLITIEGLRKLKEIIKLNSHIQELILKGNKDIDESVEMCERRMRAKETF
jgi:Leucine-rich repeat (LRR) protein